MEQKKQRQWMAMVVQGNKTQLRTPMLIWPEKIWPRLALASCLDLLVGGREASKPNWSPLYDWYTGCPVGSHASGGRSNASRFWSRSQLCLVQKIFHGKMTPVHPSPKENRPTWRGVYGLVVA